MSGPTSTPADARHEPGSGAVRRGLGGGARLCISALILAHFAVMLLMVGTTEGGRYTAPPLLHKAAAPVMPYVRFLGVNSGYRFFAPDPGPATLIWARMERANGSVQWVEHPSKERQQWTMAYQRELYPAMLLGAQIAPTETWVAPGRPRVSDLGVTYAMAYARHLARVHGGMRDSPVVKVALFSVSHAIRTPQQVRSGWLAEDLRLYFPVSLGEFSADGTPLTGAARIGHERPGILQVAERMFRESMVPGTVERDPDMPGALRRLLNDYPELRLPGDPRLLQERIGAAVMSRDVPQEGSGGRAP